MRTMKRDKPLAWPATYQALLVTEHFPRLVRHAMHERRIAVRFYVAPATPHAVFVTTDCPKGEDPFVAIYCERAAGNVDDVPATIFLAHELGHHESWLRGETSEAFEDLMTSTPRTVYEQPQTLARAMREEIVAEEERAWRYGRTILRAVLPCFPALTDYDRFSRENVAGYRTGLLLA
ncbi:MAG: hypothetical protein KF795_02375 [Labilithrix sp.]|nr:hypothetical protein [Labilithrix sp.]